MRRRDLDIVFLDVRWPFLAALLLSAVVFGACGDRVNNQERRLNSRCEVHLNDLAIGDLDPGDLTSPQDPNDVCELYMFNHDVDEEGAHESEMIEPGRWSIECTHLTHDEQNLEDDVYTGCNLEIESNVVNRYQDGLLLCSPSEGLCPERPVGSRTICSLGGDDSGESEYIFEIDWQLEHEEFEATTGSILSVDAVPSDPDRVAVTWSVTDGEQSLVGVSWLDIDGESDREPITVDVCESCNSCENQSLAPHHAFSAHEVGLRDDGSVLLASPCGWRSLVEVRPGGEVVPIDVTTPDSGLEPQFVLSVINGEEGFVALWTDGLAVYLTELIEEADRVVPISTMVITETRETQSREQVDAICFCDIIHEDSCETINCVSIWSEVTTFDSTSADTRDGQRTILVDTFYDINSFEDATDRWTRNTLTEGFDAQVAVVFPIEFDPQEYMEGLIVHRHAEHGLMARSWVVSVDVDPGMLQVDIDLQVGEQSHQISGGGLTSDFAMTPLGARTQLVGWWERERDGPFELNGAVVGVRQSWNELVATRLVLEDFELTFDPDVEEPPPPVFLRGFNPSDSSRKQLVVVAPEQRDGVCLTRVGLFSLESIQELDVDDQWPRDVTLSLIDEWEHQTDGACRPGCRGSAEWTGDGFLVALPGDRGVHVLELDQDGDDGYTVVDVSGTSSELGACNVALATGHLGETGTVVFDSGEELAEDRTLGALSLQRAFGASWTATSRLLLIDGDENQVGYSHPTTAILIADTDIDILRPQIWSTHPFEGWRQRDFAIGRLTETPEGLELSSFDYRRFPVVDSRVSVGELTFVPCDSHAPGSEDNRCVLVALSRQDYSDSRLQEGYDRIQQLTPNVETYIVPMGGASEAALPFELRPGEDWRGFAQDCVPSPRETGTTSVCSMSQLDPIEWSIGDVAGFEFTPEIVSLDDAEEALRCTASSLNLDWIFGTDRQPYEVSSMSLASVDGAERFAAAWVARFLTTGPSPNSGDVLRSSVFFSLVEPELTPFTSGLEVTSFDQPLDASQPFDVPVKDVRLLMAQHLTAGVTALDQSRFVIAWAERCSPDSGVACHFGEDDSDSRGRSVRLRAAPLRCSTVPSQQD